MRSPKEVYRLFRVQVSRTPKNHISKNEDRDIPHKPPYNNNEAQ